MSVFVLREPRNLDALMEFLAGNWQAMAKTKRPMVVECKPESTKRSTLQNRYYWAILRQISEQAWVEGRQHSEEAWHESFKRRFVGCTDVPGGGCMALSTTTLSTKDFGEYVLNVEAAAQVELGVCLLDVTSQEGRIYACGKKCGPDSREDIS